MPALPHRTRGFDGLVLPGEQTGWQAGSASGPPPAVGLSGVSGVLDAMAGARRGSRSGAPARFIQRPKTVLYLANHSFCTASPGWRRVWV